MLNPLPGKPPRTSQVAPASSRQPGDAPARRAMLSAEQLLQLQAELLGRKRFNEAVTALAQQLASSLKCERASFGWHERGQVRVIAASYVAEVHARQETARLVAAAMSEAVEQGVPLVYPEDEAAGHPILLAHHELARRQGYALCTVPLAHEGRIVGALTLERRDGSFSSGEAAQIARVAAMISPVLALKYENGLSVWRRLRRELGTRLKTLLRADTPARKPVLAGLATAVLAVALVLLVPTSHRVGAPARLEGATQRVLTAPADGYLNKVRVRPGDRVKAGQVLAELADQDLLVQQRGLAAELAQYENARVSAQARNDRTEFIVNQGQADAARARLELVQQQLDRSQLRAPFDGIVIKGDLSQSVGAPVERGAELITLAPDTGYRVMIEAEESEVADLKPGQQGRLILAALPSHTLPLTVERITPLASTADGRHYFAVYARLTGKLPALRPGMQGYAKIEVGSRAMLVNWIRGVLNWTRLRLWSWGA